MIVLDASVLIAHLDARDALHARARAVLIAASDRAWGASVLTLAETLVGPARSGRLQDAQRAIESIGVESIPLGPGDASELAVLRAVSGLTMPDCCVLQAAASVGADTVATFDERLRRAAGERGLAVLGAP